MTDVVLKSPAGNLGSSHSNTATSHYITEDGSKEKNCLLTPWQLPLLCRDWAEMHLSMLLLTQISTKNGHKYFESASSHMWDGSLEQPQCLNQKWQEEQGRDEMMEKWL